MKGTQIFCKLVENVFSKIISGLMDHHMARSFSNKWQTGARKTHVSLIMALQVVEKGVEEGCLFLPKKGLGIHNVTRTSNSHLLWVVFVDIVHCNGSSRKNHKQWASRIVFVLKNRNHVAHKNSISGPSIIMFGKYQLHSN